MGNFSILENYKNRSIVCKIDTDNFIDMVKNPDLIRKNKIDKARNYGKDSKEYDELKSTLPSIALNFDYNGYVNNKNLISSTGFIYIDVDSEIGTDFKEYSFVFAAWKSLSNRGIGILASVSGVTPDNYKEAYYYVSELLQVESDPRAVSKDRLNVLSYDKDLYHNKNYTTLDISKKVSSISIKSYCNRLRMDDTFYEVTDLLYEGKLRTSNLEDFIKEIDFKGKDYINRLGDEIKYSKLFIPKNIKIGSRNTIMFSICSQLRGLNPKASLNYLKTYCYTINNRHFKDPLDNSEVEKIVINVFRNKPTLQVNASIGIIFNPTSKLKKEEKASIVAIERNKTEGLKTLNKIENLIYTWDFEKEGKIIQKKVAKKLGKGIATVKRHWKNVKQEVKELNKDNVKK